MDRREIGSLVLIYITVCVVAASGRPESPCEAGVVYRIPGMQDADVRYGIPYKTTSHETLCIDIYYPTGRNRSSLSPAVVFVNGYPDSVWEAQGKPKLKDERQYVSWGLLTAASGMIGITYETERPGEDIRDLLCHIRRHGRSFGVDVNGIGLWSCSANTPTALSIMTSDASEYLRCAVVYYGFMPTADGLYRSTIDSLAHVYGYYSPPLSDIGDASSDLPLFIVQAGRDQFPHLNDSIAHFIKRATARNTPFVYVNYSQGHHAFDVTDNSEQSRKIIKMTLEFLRANLIGNEY